MRVEATIGDVRGAQLSELADELGVPKSALVEEALSLLLTALMGTRRGQRVAMIDAASHKVVAELATPLLTQIEWTASREKIALSRKEAAGMDALLSHPPAPTAALRNAMSRRRTPKVK